MTTWSIVPVNSREKRMLPRHDACTPSFRRWVWHPPTTPHQIQPPCFMHAPHCSNAYQAPSTVSRSTHWSSAPTWQSTSWSTTCTWWSNNVGCWTPSCVWHCDTWGCVGCVQQRCRMMMRSVCFMSQRGRLCCQGRGCIGWCWRGWLWGTGYRLV